MAHGCPPSARNVCSILDEDERGGNDRFVQLKLSVAGSDPLGIGGDGGGVEKRGDEGGEA